MSQRLQQAWLFARLVGYVFKALSHHIGRALSASLAPRRALAIDDEKACRNIVIVGAAFAGYNAAKVISAGLPKGGSYRVVVVEPNSHFNFTWVLPRFCVVEGHEHKAFIPYGGYLSRAPKGGVKWIRSRVQEVTRTSVRLQDGAEVPYEFLVIATGATVPVGLPSRVGAEDKAEGIELLRRFQRRIKEAKHVVVAGGGAAGVEVATDAKSKYPDKEVVLVHSRQAAMHRFSPGLQAATKEAFERLGMQVILGEKVVSQDPDNQTVSLTSGKTINCDCFVDCTGQKPASGVITSLAPTAVLPSGHISVKPTLQIQDDSLPNVYACGDVADTKTPNPNARSAMRQAEVVADNIVRVINGKSPRYTYAPQWGDELIKLTLGLDRSVLQFWDGKSELLFRSKDTELDLMSAGAWRNLGAKAFEDAGENKAA